MVNRKSGKKTTKPKSMRTTYMVIATIILIIAALTGSYYVYKAINKTNTKSSVESFTDTDIAAKSGSDASEYYDADKEVLIVFCKMNGCGHCDTFNENVWTNVEPKLNGTETELNKKLKLMQVDTNHPLASDVRGFPTIKKFGDDAKKYVEYNGQRSEEPFKAWCMN